MGLKKKIAALCCILCKQNKVDIYDDDECDNDSSLDSHLPTPKQSHSSASSSLFLTPKLWIESKYTEHLFVLRANIHQGQVKSYYRGSQCTSVALYSMIYHHFHDVTDWDASALDKIIRRGTILHHYFRDVKQFSRNPDGKISLEDFPTEFQITKNLRARCSSLAFGPVAPAQSDFFLAEGLPDLATYLMNSIADGQTLFVITIKAYSFGIIGSFDFVWLFDSHDRDFKGGRTFLYSQKGKACLCGFTSFDKLINHLLSMYGNSQYDARSFSFFPVANSALPVENQSDQAPEDKKASTANVEFPNDVEDYDVSVEESTQSGSFNSRPTTGTETSDMDSEVCSNNASGRQKKNDVSGCQSDNSITYTEVQEFINEVSDSSDNSSNNASEPQKKDAFNISASEPQKKDTFNIGVADSSDNSSNNPQEEEKPPTPEPVQEYMEDDLPCLQKAVNALQQEFDLAVVEKHAHEMELHDMNERLKAATEMVESLKSQEAAWRKHVIEDDRYELLLANCITAAAFLTYCGPSSLDSRKRMGEFFMQVCERHKLPQPRRRLFRNMELVEFLYKPLDMMHLEILHLPITKLILENGCFLMQKDSITAWPLICDPTSSMIAFLQKYKEEKGLVHVRYSEMRSQFENYLADGSSLLVTDCDVEDLAKDKRLRDAIQNCSRFIQEKNRFKIIVEDHEVECDRKFRLFMHTTVEPHMVPSHLAAYYSTMFFQQSRPCIAEEFHDRFLAKEKSHIEIEHIALKQEHKENTKTLEKLEQQMRSNLSCDIRLMNDLPAIQKLADLKKQYDKTVESHGRVEIGENSIIVNRSLHRPIAERASVCFDVCQYMREVNRMYQVSYAQFLALYDIFISHSERTVPKVVIEKITYNTYTTMARGLLERDRNIFSLLLALEVEDSAKKIGPGEREFLISPNYSMVIMTAMGYGQAPDSMISQAKKPFDWMTEEQFHNLQILAIYFEWFQEMFDRMPRDGRETQWRSLCESDVPENVALPDKMGDQYEHMQRLCVIRAVRSDRLMQASTIFIINVLGKKYFGDIGVDLNTMLKQSTPTLPIIMMYSHEVETVTKLFNDFANKKQQKTLSMTCNEDSAEKTAKRLIPKGMQEGCWVLLHNAHNSPHLLQNLEAMLSEEQNPDCQFRLWLTSVVNTDTLPIRLLQNSIKCVIDTPKVMKDSLIRSFSWFESYLLKQSSRPEWPVMLHNLCYLHAAIQLRARYSNGGWNDNKDFHNIGYSELQIIYGSYITDEYDQNSLSAIVDYWVSPAAVKKDFDVAKLKYRHPTAFYNTNPRLNNLIKALDGLNNHYLDIPEGCRLHPSNIEVTSLWIFKFSTRLQTLSNNSSRFKERRKCITLLVRVYELLYMNTQHRMDSVLLKTRLPPDKQKCFECI